MTFRLPRLFVSLCATALLAGCGPTALDDEDVVDPSDLEWDEASGRADGTGQVYNPSRIVPQDAFEHGDALTAGEVQAFLESTPYDGRRSFLADLQVSPSTRFSQALVEIAGDHGLNPLVLLVTLQKESGLISKSSAPSRHRVDFAFGCGCHDGQACYESFRGIEKQLACAAEQLRGYLDEIDEDGHTRAGWAPGQRKQTLDGISVLPANRATAALYTYTPWSLRGQGGNWLFWNVWNRYADALGYRMGTSYGFNEGFIGGSCETDTDCAYFGGRCDSGICTMSCEVSCPDADYATTSFCITGSGGAGMCVAQCGDSSCGPNQRCEARPRHNDRDTVREVCVPL